MSSIVRISFIIVLTTFVASAIAFSPRTTSSKRPRLSISSRSRGAGTGTAYIFINSRLFDGKSVSSIDKDDENALELGRTFVKSIMENEYEPIPNSNGMSVLRKVVDLETGKTGDVLLRRITIPFWQECIDEVNTPDVGYRIAAIGTPGIGKTTATPILIRMLLKENKTVVYLFRTMGKLLWYYEFGPGPNNSVLTKVYPETMNPYKIPSLQDESTYYIVDPGITKDDCNPPYNFKPKVILVPSPDSGHWGGSEFTKSRRGVEGFFLFMPLWSLEELLSARPVLCTTMTEEEVNVNYNCFGGIPRHVFGSNAAKRKALDAQNMALNQLSDKEVTDIAEGKMDAVDSFASGNAKSSLMGYDSVDNDKGSFAFRKAVLLSPLLEESIHVMHDKSLGNHAFPRQG